MANTCEECGFDWEMPVLDEIRVVSEFPERASIIVDAAGDAVYRRPSADVWSANEYIWHMVDAMRMFAEWLHMTRVLDHPVHVYGPGDQLAEARIYAEQPVETGLWGLQDAVELYTREAVRADPGRLVEYKGWRDVTAAEVIGFAAHEAVHHMEDLRRVVQPPVTVQD